jgi:RNA polymerase sigma factor (sigma-70 family)
MSPWLSDLLLRTQTDERLVALARLGNQRAEEAIVARYRDALLGYARHISSDRAEDLVQQTLLSAVLALRAGTEVGHLRGWLHGILRNQACRESATGAQPAALEEADAVTEPVHQLAERRIMAVDALVAMGALPTRQRDALVQSAIQGRSRAEVAHNMGLSEGAVRQLVHRARAAVRASVTAVLPLPTLRWLGTPRTPAAPGLSDAALGAGAASGLGLAMKVGIGAVVASGILAAGVITGAGTHHNRAHRSSSLRAGVATRGGTSGASHGGSRHGAARMILVAGRRVGLDGTADRPRRSGHGGSGPSTVSSGRFVSSDFPAPSRAAGSGSGKGDGSGSGSPGRGSSQGTSQGSGEGEGPSTTGSGTGETTGGGGGGGSSGGGDGGGSGSGGSGGDGGGTDGGGGNPNGGSHGGGTTDGGGTTNGGGHGGSSDGGGTTGSGSDGGSAASSGSDGEGSPGGGGGPAGGQSHGGGGPTSGNGGSNSDGGG